MKIHRGIIQGSEAWHKIRCGIPTASEFDKIITPAREQKAKWEKYLYTLAGERLTGMPAVSFESPWMSRGKEVEEEARNVYAMTHEVEVEQVGFITTDDGRAGCSPDGLLPNKGLEIKSPSMHVHVEYLINGVLPLDYKCQVQGSMLVTGFDEWDFWSYYPNLPPLELTIKRDDAFCAKLKVLLDEFCDELDAITDKLRRMV